MLVQVGRRRELALGQAVAAVVLDDVDDLHVAPADVLELPHADIGRVAVAADADAYELGVGHHGPGCDRRHAAVERIEAVAVLQEIGRRLAGTADAAQLDRGIGIDPGRLACLDQVAGDAVVAAPLAQGRRQPLKGHGRQRERVAVALDLDHRIGGHGFIAS